MRGENYIPACLRDLPKQKSRSAETKRKKHDRDLADLTITECIQRIKAARRSKPKDWERGYNSAISVLELFALEVKGKQWAGTEGAVVNQKITTEEPQPAAQDQGEVQSRERWTVVCGHWQDTTLAIHGERTGHIASGIDEDAARAIINAHNEGLPPIVAASTGQEVKHDA